MTPEPAKRATEPKPASLFMNPSRPSRNVKAVARYASLPPRSPIFLGLTPQALCWRRLRRLVARSPPRYRTRSDSDGMRPFNLRAIDHLFEHLRLSIASGRYRPRFCTALATSLRFTDLWSPERMSLIATSPRARSSSPTIATKGMLRDEAYLNCLPILSASG